MATTSTLKQSEKVYTDITTSAGFWVAFSYVGKSPFVHSQSVSIIICSLDLVLGTKNTEADEIKFLLRRSRHLAMYKRCTLQIQTQ